MKKVILLDNEKFNWAMADLVELKGQIQDVLIDNEEAIKAIENILKAVDEAAAVTELAEDGEQFEIVNAEEGTFMDISEELEP